MVELNRTNLVKNLLRPKTIVVAGDSITAGASISSSPAEYAAGYAEASVYTAGLRLIFNAGVAGNTSAQLLGRFQSDIINNRPNCVMIMIGTNDFVSGMSNSAYASLFNNIEQMVLMSLDAGILPILVTPPPKNGAAVEAKRSQPYYYWLTEFYGIPLIDAYRMWVDPATGQYVASYTDDGVHPNRAGIAAVFPSIGTQIANIPSLIGQEYFAAVSEAAAGDAANMVRNGSFALGTAPSSITGWTTNTTNNTITLENTTLPDTGKICKNVVSLDGGIYPISGTAITVTAGNELILSGKIKTSNITATTGGAHFGFGLSGGGQTRPLRSWLQNGTFKFSNRFIVPAGKTSITPSLYVDKVGTYEVSNLTVIDRTAMASIWQPGQQNL